MSERTTIELVLQTLEANTDDHFDNSDLVEMSREVYEIVIELLKIYIETGR